MSSLASMSTGALMASNYANKSQKELNNSIARISSGKRAMNGRDPAGQGIADSLNSSSRSWNVAARNAEDGISAAQIAESSLMEIAALAQRLREIAIQADNATFQSTTDVAALDAEAAAITKTIEAISTETKFNGVAVLSASDQNFTIGVTDAGDLTTITSKGIADPSATTAAAGAETQADTALGEVGEALGNIAAAITSLKSRQAVAYSNSANMLAAASRLQDTDFAASSANLAKFSILNQSAMAMVTQANQAQSAVLAVLQ